MTNNDQQSGVINCSTGLLATRAARGQCDGNCKNFSKTIVSYWYCIWGLCILVKLSAQLLLILDWVLMHLCEAVGTQICFRFVVNAAVIVWRSGRQSISHLGPKLFFRFVKLSTTRLVLDWSQIWLLCILWNC